VTYIRNEIPDAQELRRRRDLARRILVAALEKEENQLYREAIMALDGATKQQILNSRKEGCGGNFEED